MISRFHPALLATLALALGACAAAPLDLGGIDRVFTADRAAADPVGAVGQRVAWGGLIVSTSTLEKETQLEVLAYPLDGSGRPLPEGPPSVRFLAVKGGFLETAVYAPGRFVTVAGPVAAPRPGRIGERAVTDPVVTVEQLHLWPRAGEGGGSSVHFGIGVSF